MKKTIVYLSLTLLAVLAVPACNWLWESENNEWDNLCEEHRFCIPILLSRSPLRM